jgi:hypothetical protein
MRLALLVLVVAACQRSGPVLTTPKGLFADLTQPGALERYRDGATFVGVVKTVGEQEPGKPVVWMDVDGENLMVLELAAPAPDDLEAGDILYVTCRIAGASGALMMLTDCVRGV